MQPQRRIKPSFFPFAGWLFADLMLALVMLFLVANSVGVIPPAPIPPTPTPTTVPTATLVVPTPTVVRTPCLERSPESITFDISSDPNAFQVAKSDTISTIIKTINADNKLVGDRRAGLVFIYSGYPTDGSQALAVNIAKSLVSFLKNFGSTSSNAFTGNPAYHDPLFNFNSPYGHITIEIYLFGKDNICS